MVIIGRKLCIMASFYLGNNQQGWMGGVAALITSMVFHVYARPYENIHTDWCEFFQLVATVLVLVSGAVFTILGEHDTADTGARAFRVFLATMGGLMIAATLLSVIVAQYYVYTALRSGTHEEDYKVRVTKMRLEEAKQLVLELEGLVKTQQHEVEERTKQVETTKAFLNPLSVATRTEARVNSNSASGAISSLTSGE
eukprot:COSAG02_NODE_282_length_25773_cov_1666.149762_3_plen_198_part_00